MHYYKHHIGDFIKDTSNLDDHQLATYMRMVWAYYSEEVPFSSDIEDIAFAMRSDEKTVRLLLRHYFKESNDGWRHGRCDREIAEFHDKKEKAATSASARWKNTKKYTDVVHSGCDSNAFASQNECERIAIEPKIDANQEPITNNQEEQNIFVSSKLPTCPHQQIIYAYGKVLPGLPQPRIWEGQREKNLASRWKWVLADLAKNGKPCDAEAGIDYFVRLFKYISTSDFLTGRSGTWSADLGWIVKAENFAKIIQGNYENKDSV